MATTVYLISMPEALRDVVSISVHDDGSVYVKWSKEVGILASINGQPAMHSPIVASDVHLQALDLHAPNPGNLLLARKP